MYKVYEDMEIYPCTGDYDCVGDAFVDEGDAQSIFTTNVRAMSDTTYNTTHYIVGDYWYTSDLIEEFNSVSTGIHRKNAAIALVTQMLTSSLDSEDLHNLYVDLSSRVKYNVQDYEGAPGQTIEEIMRSDTLLLTTDCILVLAYTVRNTAEVTQQESSQHLQSFQAKISQPSWTKFT